MNAKTIMPVTVEEEGKIALTEWLERFLHKDPEYREKYLIETEKGPVLNWEQLDRDHMVLTVTAMKDGQVCERRILLKPHKQDIVRTRVEEIAHPEDIVICKFKVESWQEKTLSVAEAEGIYRNQYGIEDEILAKDLAQNTYDAMLLSKEEGLTVTDIKVREHFAYWTTFRILWEHNMLEGFQVEVKAGEIRITADFKAKLKRLVEVKNISPSTVYSGGWQEDLKSELVRYKEVVEAGRAKETVLFFCTPLDEEKMAYLNRRLNDWFDDLSWLKICDGVREFDKYIELLAGS